MVKRSYVFYQIHACSMRLQWALRNAAFLKILKISIGMLTGLVFILAGQAGIAAPAEYGSQTANSMAGIKLILEGQELEKSGTRASRIEAINKYQAAYEFFEKDKSKEGMGAALFATGAAYSSLGQKRKALDVFLSASPLLKELPDSSFYAMTVAGIGMAYSELGEWKSATTYLNQAIELFRQTKASEHLGSVLCVLGATYIQQGQKQKGLEYVTQSLKLGEETQNFGLEMNARTLIGSALSSLGQKRKALEVTERALQIAKEKKSREGEAMALLTLGGIKGSLGDRSEALRNYEEALQIRVELNDPSGKSVVLNNVAEIYAALGDTEKAITLYEEAIRLQEDAGSPEEGASSINGLALIYDMRAEPLKALSLYQKALAYSRKIRHQGQEAAVLINIAKVYDSFNQHEQALKANSDAVAVYRAIQDPLREATAVANQGAMYTRLRRYDESFPCFKRALELHEASEDRAGQAHTLAKMGNTYKEMGNLSKALDAYTRSLALMTAVSDRQGEAVVTENIGYIYDQQQDYPKASEYYRRALSLTQMIGDRRGEATLLSNLGFLSEKQGAFEEAETLYGQAIKAREQVRTAARVGEFKTEVANESAALYSRAILLKVKSGKNREAFELSESAKSRTLLDQMNGARIDPGKSIDPELIKQEQALRFELATLEKQIREEMAHGGSPEAFAALKERLEQRRKTYEEVTIRLKATNPEYAELQGNSPISLAEIQRQLKADRTLLSYYVTPGKTLIFVITQKSFQVVEVPVGEPELQKTIGWFRGFANLREAKPASLKQLDDWLVAPVKSYLKTPLVCVIPHGVLHQLPFAVTFDGKLYFGERHMIYYLPSASLLPLIERKKQPASKSLLAISQARAEGKPPLRFVDEEAESLSRLYHGMALLTGRYSKSEVKRLAADFDILHIASHAELNARNPLFSRIFLTPDQQGNQVLEVREVYDMDLKHTSLVVLSACETQLGAQSQGDEIVSLNRAFIYAGAASVIASLWVVDDQATSLLMRSFYQHLKRGMGKAEALRQAQAETRARYPNPYYWAAFVLTGDGGTNGQR